MTEPLNDLVSPYPSGTLSPWRRTAGKPGQDGCGGRWRPARAALEHGLSPADLQTLLLPHRRVAVRWTAFGFPPMRERMSDTVLPAVTPLPDGVTVAEDPARERARGYYERGAIRIDIAGDGGWQEVGDGGFTSWTAQLLGDAKERTFISCASTERLAALAQVV